MVHLGFQGVSMPNIIKSNNEYEVSFRLVKAVTAMSLP